MTTYYISGPMRGLPEHNYPLFHSCEKALAHAVLGDDDSRPREVINPARHFGGDKGRALHEYMQADLLAVLRCDVVVLLPGWRSSVGVHKEMMVAQWTGKRFMVARQDPADAWSFAEITTTGPPWPGGS